MIRLVKTSSSHAAVAHVARTINSTLKQDRRVLWLLSGGSAVGIAAETVQRLDKDFMQHLTVSLVDERFGPIGHAESIWQQLKEADFNAPAANMLPVLQGQGFEQTAATWEKALHNAFKTNQYTIALMGIGPDGHTAGILPHSPASAYNGDRLVFAYQSNAIPGVRPAFARITLTGHGLSKLDQAVVVAMGDAKRKALENLARNSSADEQPAQLLKQIPNVTIFNDQVGGVA